METHNCKEPVLFNGTVLDNITNGLVGTQWETDSREVKMRHVQEASKLAFAHDFIESLPQGYDTHIGERGGLLSGGQKQRIAIARSIISKPRILLLDEATSALDPQAEGIVQKALDSVSQNRTTIVIAHKLATIRNADNIVVMSKGKIMEQGSHEGLMAINGIFTNLVTAQDLKPAASERSQAQERSPVTEGDTSHIAEPLSRKETIESQQLQSLKDREDHDQYGKRGILYNIWRLVKTTPELRVHFAVIGAACIAAGEF